jgi:hypothetical protein
MPPGESFGGAPVPHQEPSVMLTRTCVVLAVLALTQWIGRPVVAADPAPPHHMSDDVAKCLKACTECAKECEICSSHCLALLGKGEKTHERSARSSADCADFCGLAAKMMSRSSPMMSNACEACAKACDDCTAACEKADDAQMKKTAQSCRDCAKECRAMVKTVAVK